MASWLLRRIGKPAIALAAFAAIVAMATVTAGSLAVTDLAATATQLDETDLALGSAAVTRAAMAQAVVFAVDNANGTATDAAFVAALAEAGGNLDAYNQLQTVVAERLSAGHQGELSGLSSYGGAVLDVLRAGDVESARAVLEGDFESAYQSSVAVLAGERAVLATDVASARSLAGSTSTAIRLAVILGLPALVLLVGWSAHRRRLAQLQETRRTDVEAANDRIERMREMLLAISHRLRTPLTSIYGLSDVLVQTKRIQGLDRELVTLINAESANLHRIAEDVLTATQLEAGTLTLETGIVPLHEVVEEAVKPIRSAGLDIKVDCPEVWVLSDGPKLRQILRNLVSNAVQHGAEPVVVAVTESDGSVQCAVSDHGGGLGATEPATGRGLDVANGLAGLIGATLDQTRADGMTTFTLSWSESGEAAANSGVQDAAPGAVRTVPQPLSEEPVGTGNPS
ncbi:MAG: HAMP domain-containing histidine kinase [bacterium]|nr:HAMP domain-containing histidine kinase [bacterium]